MMDMTCAQCGDLIQGVPAAEWTAAGQHEALCGACYRDDEAQATELRQAAGQFRIDYSGVMIVTRPTVWLQ